MGTTRSLRCGIQYPRMSWTHLYGAKFKFNPNYSSGSQYQFQQRRIKSLLSHPLLVLQRHARERVISVSFLSTAEKPWIFKRFACFSYFVFNLWSFQPPFMAAAKVFCLIFMYSVSKCRQSFASMASSYLMSSCFLGSSDFDRYQYSNNPTTQHPNKTCAHLSFFSIFVGCTRSFAIILSS